jgi:hypothetical protein
MVFILTQPRRCSATAGLGTDEPIMMKQFLAVVFTAILAGCTADSYQSLTPGAAPINADAAHRGGAHDARFNGLSTVQLQERRLALYKRVPRSARRFGSSSQYTTTYTSFGGNLPEQDEIILIERELNYRYGRGDKAAYFEPQVPYVPPVAQQPGGT